MPYTNFAAYVIGVNEKDFFMIDTAVIFIVRTPICLYTVSQTNYTYHFIFAITLSEQAPLW